MSLPGALDTEIQNERARVTWARLSLLSDRADFRECSLYLQACLLLNTNPELGKWSYVVSCMEAKETIVLAGCLLLRENGAGLPRSQPSLDSVLVVIPPSRAE